MSQAKNRHQAERRLQTAQEDLRAARALLDAQMYAQACFYAQQSGEKALKAIWRLIDADSWGHSIQRLIAEFPQPAAIPDLETWVEYGALCETWIKTQLAPDVPA